MAFLSHTDFVGIIMEEELFCIRDTYPSKILEKHSFPKDTECLFMELNFRKCKWLLCGTYHPSSQNNEYYFNYLGKALDTYSNYEKVLVVGNFNTEITEHYIASFLYKHALSNLVKDPSCMKLLLTNNSDAFQKTMTAWFGLLDYQKLVLTVLKTSIPRANPRQITYRDYKQFDSLNFNNELKNVLTNENIDNSTKFDEKFLEVFDKHATLKSKLLRANHASYVL